MAFSKPQSKKDGLPTLQEGDKLLTFHGSTLREAECVRVVVEDNKQVKYLVRYRSQGAMGVGLGTSMGMGLGLSGASGGAAAYPSILPGPSSSSAAPYSSLEGACGSSGGSGDAVPSKAEVPSTSRALPSPSGEGPSAGQGGSEQLSHVVSWDYEWIPESCVLRCDCGNDSDSDEESSDSSDSEDEEDDSSATSSSSSDKTSDASQGSSGGDGDGQGDGVEANGAEAKMAKAKMAKAKMAEANGAEANGAEANVAEPPLKRRALEAPAKNYLKKREVKVTLPNALKPLLVKDWELVTQGKNLFKLPAEKSVDAILADYAVFQENSGSLNSRYAVPELVSGIKEYFNVMLGTQLLYKFERPQYVELLATHPNMHMSQLYGGAHLLRLFVQIGSMLAYTALDDHSLNKLLGHMDDFLRYLACNPSVLFTAADYQVASAEYQQNAE